MVELISSGSPWGVFIWGVDAYGTEVYQMPFGLTFQEESVEVKIERHDLALADGAKSEGGEIKDRRVTVSGNIWTGARSTTLALIDELRWQCSRPNLRLRLDSGRFIYLAKLESFSTDPEEQWDRRACRARISWQVDDPFWYSETLQTVSIDVAGDGTFEVDGLSGGKPCERKNHPILTVTPAVGTNLPEFGLQNLSDGGAQFYYADPGLIAGRSVVINSIDGTVQRGTTKTLRYFDGDWLDLITDWNRFQYSGTAATLQFVWRPRWL